MQTNTVRQQYIDNITRARYMQFANMTDDEIVELSHSLPAHFGAFRPTLAVGPTSSPSHGTLSDLFVSRDENKSSTQESTRGGAGAKRARASDDLTIAEQKALRTGIGADKPPRATAPTPTPSARRRSASRPSSIQSSISVSPTPNPSRVLFTPSLTSSASSPNPVDRTENERPSDPARTASPIPASPDAESTATTPTPKKKKTAPPTGFSFTSPGPGSAYSRRTRDPPGPLTGLKPVKEWKDRAARRL